jgi:hypothetical protein
MSNDNDARHFNEPDREPEPLPILPKPASAAPCPDCRGSGRVVLLTSSQNTKGGKYEGVRGNTKGVRVVISGEKRTQLEYELGSRERVRPSIRLSYTENGGVAHAVRDVERDESRKIGVTQSRG